VKGWLDPDSGWILTAGQRLDPDRGQEMEGQGGTHLVPVMDTATCGRGPLSTHAILLPQELSGQGYQARGRVLSNALQQHC
jgi:hypothetical protein